MAGDNLANIDLTTSEEDMIRLFMQTADFYIFGYKNRRENGVWKMKLEDTPANRNQGEQTEIKVTIKSELEILRLLESMRAIRIF